MRVRRRTVLLAGAGSGAALSYLFDPDRGKRRRALMRDKAVRLSAVGRGALGAAWRDARNRTLGLMARARSRGAEEYVSDDVLAERVRSELGFLVSHPGAIEVEAGAGRVTLRGPVLVDEVEELLSGVSRVRGVREVEDRLEVHAEPGSVPALQGEPSRRRARGRRFEFLQEHWSPSARFAAGGAGAWLALYGLRRRGLGGATAQVAGLGLLARSITDTPIKRLIGAG